MLVNKILNAGRTIAMTPAFSRAAPLVGAVDTLASGGHHGGVRGSRAVTTAMPSPPGPRDDAGGANDAGFLASASGWARRFASMRERGEHFGAFSLLTEVQRHVTELVALPQSEFRAAWDSLLQIGADREAKSELAAWMLETAQARLRRAITSSFGAVNGPRADDLHAAIGQAVQAWNFQAESGSESTAALQFWQQLEGALKRVLPEMFYHAKQAPEVLGHLVLQQARLLTLPFLEAGRPTQGLVTDWIDALAKRAEADGIARLPWLTLLGETHGVDASVVTAAVMRHATSSCNRAGLMQQPLEGLSAAQAEALLSCYIEHLLEEARGMGTSVVTGYNRYDEWGPQIPNCFPLRDLHRLPELVARLNGSAAQKEALVRAVEQASEVLVDMFSSSVAEYPWQQQYIDFLRNNHASWLFVSGLNPKVRDARHVETIALGLRDADQPKGWRWTKPVEHRTTEFAALAQAARAAGLSDAGVRQAWEATRTRAREAAEKRWAECVKNRDSARARFDRAHDEAEQTKQELLKINEAAVGW